MYKTEPWTLSEKRQSTAIKKVRLNFFKEDVAVSTARVMELFKKNKDKIFTNQDISNELSISLGTVSSVTNRLEQLSSIKIVKVKQSVSAISQMFQHYDGPMNAVEKIKVKKDTARIVRELFEEDVNRVLTKKEITKIINNRSIAQIDTSLRILLLSGTIKITKDINNGIAHYQHSTGNKKGLEVLIDSDESYSTINAFLEKNNIKSKARVFREAISDKKYKLFYSSKGLVRMYLKVDLEKCATKIQKKGLLGGLFK